MCYAGGPYCDGYAKERLQKASVAFKEKGDDKSRLDWMKKQVDYNGTPTGQKELDQKIAKTTDPVKAKQLQMMKEQGAEVYSQKLALAKQKDAEKMKHDTNNQRRKEKKNQPVEAPTRRIAVGRIEVNDDDYSHPQANRLDKVSTTVDAVEAGANTAQSISQSLGVVDRQGYYYGDAAGYLGFVAHQENGDLKEYYLTEKGQAFAGASPEQRKQIIRDTVSTMPLMQVYREDGEQAALDFMKDSSEANVTTAQRRLATLKAWDKDIQSDGFSESIAQDKKEGQTRFMDAKTYADQQRAKKSESKITERRGAICGECFMEKPLSGVCPNCED